MPHISTGQQVPDYSAMDASPMKAEDKPKKTKLVYPDITLRGEAAEAVMAAHKPGDTFKAEVTFKCTEATHREGMSQTYGDPPSEKRVQLEIQGIEDESAEPPDDEEDEDAGSAVDKFRAAKAAPVEED